jgi:acyl-CoA synthetase (NDP forming)
MARRHRLKARGAPAAANPGLEMDAIFRPRSVAVIGASRQANTIGREILRNLVEFEFTGPVYPVNPNAATVGSMKSYPSVLDIPDEVDLAVVTVPRELVLEVVDQCGRKGVRGLVVITAGFRRWGVGGHVWRPISGAAWSATACAWWAPTAWG